MTYVFGREVTVKLPEPNDEMHKVRQWSDVNDWGERMWKVNGRPGHPPTPVIYRDTWDEITIRQIRAFGLALLAAADYAEGGGDAE